MTWQSQGSLPLVIGERYRMVLKIRAPYNDVTEAAVRLQFEAKAIQNHYKLESFRAVVPFQRDTVDTSYMPTWTAYIEFTVRPDQIAQEAGLDPRALLVLAGVVVTVALAFVLVESKIERLITTTINTGEKAAKDLAKSTVFNPGFLIIALAAFGIFFWAKKG